MEFLLKTGERELITLAMKLLSKKAEQAQKLLTKLRLSTIEVDTLLSRAGLLVEKMQEPLGEPIDLTPPLRLVGREGLALLFEEVDATRDDELDLGIDTEASTAKQDEIRALTTRISEQLQLVADAG